jgi:hypothetical protein
MADWPDVDELKQVLNVDDDPDKWGTTLARVLASGIDQVKSDIGEWDDEVDEPTDRQAQAALRAAELIALRPEAQAAGGTGFIADDPTYVRLLKGSRRRFAFS